MGIKIEGKANATGVGYYQSSVWDAEDIVEQIGLGGWDKELDEEEPVYSRYNDASRFKVTVTVEQL